jgi:UDP-2,4-diacetamido-2,4,6-trideoxy-beta-L-altropyranose hydrolase
MPEHLRPLVAERGYDFISLSSPERVDVGDVLSHSHWLGTTQHADAQDTVRALSDRSWDWLVVDHYALDARWESALRGTSKRILVIDDLADRRHDCDVLLDQNALIDTDPRYAGNVPQHCRLLLGPRYALLREEFRRLRASIRPRSGTVRRVLIFFGGVDPRDHTSQAIEALIGIGVQDLQVDVVIGAQHPRRHDIESACSSHRLTFHVETRCMAELMAAADLAIGASGSANWERCCLGLPAIAIATADNQLKVGRVTAEAGACLYLGASENLSDRELAASLKLMISNSGLRTSMSRVSMELADGLGCQRVAKAMAHEEPLRVRPARPDDAERAFAWRNAEETRHHSHDPKVFTLQEHVEWFQQTLIDSKRLLLIGEGSSGPVGVLRYDFVDRAATVSIYLDPSLYGQGYGARLLSAGEHWLRVVRPDIERLRAEVLSGNPRSRRVFAEAGFSEHSVLCERQLHAASPQAAPEGGCKP